MLKKPNRKSIYENESGDILWGDMMISPDHASYKKYEQLLQSGQQGQPFPTAPQSPKQKGYLSDGAFSSPESIANFTGQPPWSTRDAKQLDPTTGLPYAMGSSRIPNPTPPGEMLEELNNVDNQNARNFGGVGGRTDSKGNPILGIPLRSPQEGTIREPLFGRNPNGSPKPRPAGITSEQVAALSAAQEKRYASAKTPTKRIAQSTSSKATTPSGVIGYDALNQPVYGRKAPLASQGIPPAPYQDTRGDPIKLDYMIISGGLGKSDQSKKTFQDTLSKKPEGIGGSYRVIDGEVRFFGGATDTATETTNSMGVSNFGGATDTATEPANQKGGMINLSGPSLVGRRRLAFKPRSNYFQKNTNSGMR